MNVLGRLRARLGADRPGPERACSVCRHFTAEPAAIEAAMPGLTSFGSGFASTRDQDGLCTRHGRYLSARSTCAAFDPPLNFNSAPQP